MPKYELTFGVTTYASYTIAAPDGKVANDIASELICSDKFISEKLNDAWASYITSGDADDYTDAEADEVDDSFDVTLGADELERYVGKHVVSDMHHNVYLARLNEAIACKDWDSAAVYAIALSNLHHDNED